MLTVSFKMPDELAARIAAAAGDRGVSRSALVRDAVESYLQELSTGKGSVAELAGNLVGAVKGPRDLSSHPKHMEGFGD